ncbi:MAG: HAMP domain-containing histidine kinase [Deltaproteobacteria bacterium]|nr:HAMP domain-containing histidine kinase [Deltaproteobacteria bacterium]
MPELKEMQRLAELGAMAAATAHELNNYLGVLQLRLEMLARQLSGEAELTALRAIQDTLGRATHLAYMMLVLGREGTRTLASLGELVSAVVGFLKPQNRYDLVALEVEVGPGLPLVAVNPPEIQQVVMNLLNIVADRVREGSILVRVQQAGPARVVVEMVGQPEPSRHPPAEEPGTGLDLVAFRLQACERILAEHDGLLETGGGPGTSFRVVLPVAEGG